MAALRKPIRDHLAGEQVAAHAGLSAELSGRRATGLVARVGCLARRAARPVRRGCPHYLTHTEDSELGGMGKASPPFRSKDDQEALWEAIFDGTVDLVASDHNARKR